MIKNVQKQSFGGAQGPPKPQGPHAGAPRGAAGLGGGYPPVAPGPLGVAVLAPERLEDDDDDHEERL